MERPRYTPAERARMGDAIYERDILPRLTAEDTGRIVAIDVESGAYAVDRDELRAVHLVLDPNPGAQIWVKRVGFAYVERLPYMNTLRPAREA